MREGRMNDTERLAVGSLVTLVLFLAPGYLLHVSPRFAGSLAGGILGIAGAILMLLVLAYPLVKYSPTRIRQRITRVVSMRALLTFHVVVGVIGPLLGILHSGHKYQSPLGIALILTLLVVVISGFIGRYYFSRVSAELREQQSMLATLRSAYNSIAAALSGGANSAAPKVAILPLVGSIADLEESINARETLKHALTRWTVVHVVAGIVLYVLLAIHIVGEVYYGLRWLP
jgi:hypothetical protein